MLSYLVKKIVGYQNYYISNLLFTESLGIKCEMICPVLYEYSIIHYDYIQAHIEVQ